MSQPTAATVETTQRCVGFALTMLRTHQTAPRRPQDGPRAWCVCGRLALACQINSALRAAGLLPALDQPGVVGKAACATPGAVGAAAGREHPAAAPTLDQLGDVVDPNVPGVLGAVTGRQDERPVTDATGRP